MLHANDAEDINFGIKQTVLPVTFGDISANIIDNRLYIKWSTLAEINISRFEIEISNDGKTFTRIGTTASQAVNGNSNVKTDYHFRTAIPVSAAFAIIAFAMLLPVSKKRKWSFLSLFVLTLVLVHASCNKNSPMLSNEANSRLFIRIVQVDMDDKKAYSKVVAVLNQTK